MHDLDLSRGHFAYGTPQFARGVDLRGALLDADDLDGAILPDPSLLPPDLIGPIRDMLFQNTGDPGAEGPAL